MLIHRLHYLGYELYTNSLKNAVAAFQNAKKILDIPFSEMIGGLAYYHEVVRQRLQINRLFLDRTDTVILDRLL